MAEKVKKDTIPNKKIVVEHLKFEAHEDDWVPLVSPHSAPEIIWAVRGKCQHLLSIGWVYAWDYLRDKAHEFWKMEAEHKQLIEQLQNEMDSPKYNRKRKSK